MTTLNQNKERSTNNIVRVERKFNNTLIYFSDGLVETVEHSIDDLEKDFSDLEFWRIHPNHLINPTYFNKTISITNESIVMQDGTELPINKKLWKKEINNSKRGRLKRFLSLSNHSKSR